MVEQLAVKKARSTYEQLIKFYPDENIVIIAADTVVSIDDQILLKPHSHTEAKSMLRKLSGRSHFVFTGVCILQVSSGFLHNSIKFNEKTEVIFNKLTDREIETYIATDEPMDKAGAYAIQGKAASFVKEIRGNYHNVVGLPISRLVKELQQYKMLAETPKCKAAIFDLDGTLMNTLDSLAYSSNKVLQNLDKPEIDIDKYRYFVGNGAGKLVERFLKYYDLDLPTYYESAFKNYMTIFSKYKNYKVMVYEGLYPVLKEMKERGIKLGVYTNKPDREAKAMLGNTFGYDFFDEIRGDLNGKNLKPDPHAILEWSKKWSIPTNEILYLGDTNTDMQTGNAANAYTIGVSWGFRDRKELFEHGAYDVIDEPSWILNYI